MPIQFSRAAYLPNAGTSNEICPDHIKSLHTDPSFRIDSLVSRIAQRHFGLGKDDEYRISVKRDAITLRILDENGDETDEIHTLTKDKEGFWQVTPHEQASKAMDPKDQLEIAQDASTIIERVKAVWNRCQLDHAAPKDGTAGTPSPPVGSCHGHNGQPIIIHHCGHSSAGGDISGCLVQIQQLQGRIHKLEESLNQVDDAEANDLRKELAEARRQLQELQDLLNIQNRAQ